MAAQAQPGGTGVGARPDLAGTARVADLERQVATLLRERAEHAAAVQAELQRLSALYDDLRGDLETARRERDGALESVRAEREARARETLELAERLDEAAVREQALRESAAADSLQRFVAERLDLAVHEYRELAPGELPEVPGFRVHEPLGRGGMASVFRAERLEDGAEVALKLLHGSPGQERTRTELFLREAALTLQLDHPGLLRALDAGDCVHGPYLVLPLVDGRSLAMRVRRDGPLPEAEVLSIASSIGRALRFCARLGLTHRDVKPSNLLQGRDGRVLLSDFGLAALTTGDAGRPYGSPGYAAPEQMVAPDTVDERADIYAFGCSLWHLLVGRRPFPGTPRESFDAARINDLPDPRDEGAEVSHGLAQVLRRMGRCERDRRYRSWDECLLDIALVERGNPPLAAHLADVVGATPPDHGDPEPVPPAPPPEPPVAAPAADPHPAPGPEATHGDEPTAAPVGAVQRAVERLPRHVRLPLAATLAALVALALGRGCAPSPADALVDRARALVREGRAAEASAALRAAAELVGPDDAARLAREADDLDAR